MAIAYTKEFLIEVFLHRFRLYNSCIEDHIKLEQLASDCYDKCGKDKFRVYASVDAAAIKEYKEFIANGQCYI